MCPKCLEILFMLILTSLSKECLRKSVYYTCTFTCNTGNHLFCCRYFVKKPIKCIIVSVNQSLSKHSFPSTKRRYFSWFKVDPMTAKYVTPPLLVFQRKVQTPCCENYDNLHLVGHLHPIYLWLKAVSF